MYDYIDEMNNELRRRGMLNDYIPTYPILRIENDKLYVGSFIFKDNTEVFNSTIKVKPIYWALQDVETLKVLEFNETKEKDYVMGHDEYEEYQYGDDKKTKQMEIIEKYEKEFDKIIEQYKKGILDENKVKKSKHNLQAIYEGIENLINF